MIHLQPTCDAKDGINVLEGSIQRGSIFEVCLHHLQDQSSSKGTIDLVGLRALESRGGDCIGVPASRVRWLRPAGSKPLWGGRPGNLQESRRTRAERALNARRLTCTPVSDSFLEEALSGLRDRARTLKPPRRCRAATTPPPCLPVAPQTATNLLIDAEMLRGCKAAGRQGNPRVMWLCLYCTDAALRRPGAR